MKKNYFYVSAIALVLAAQTSAQDQADTLSVSDFNLQEIEVVARVEQPTTNHALIRKEDLNNANMGQNLPYLLSITPSFVSVSEDGVMLSR